MPISKIIYCGETLVDLTSDTVDESTLAKGVTAHRADGTQITGTMEAGDDGVLPPSVEVISAEADNSEVTVTFESISSEYEEYLGNPAYILVLKEGSVPMSATDGIVVKLDAAGNVVS